jgi:hypothetical protein
MHRKADGTNIAGHALPAVLAGQCATTVLNQPRPNLMAALLAWLTTSVDAKACKAHTLGASCIGGP